MRLFSWVCVALVSVAVGPGPAHAQDDDLAPLPRPKPPKPKPAKPPKPKKPPASEDELAPIHAAKAELRVTSPVPGAVLHLDGRELGTLPWGPQPVAPGEHTVLVKRPGFTTFLKKVVVPPRKTLELDAKLNPLSAVLTVQVDVPGAQVLLDGKSLGLAPVTEVEVAPRIAEVVVRREGYLEEKRTVGFVAGRDYPIAVTLTPARSAISAVGSGSEARASDAPRAVSLAPTEVRPGAPLEVHEPASRPLTSRWYFWVGAAAVVAGLAVGSVAIARNVSAEPAICGARPCDSVMHFP